VTSTYTSTLDELEKFDRSAQDDISDASDENDNHEPQLATDKRQAERGNYAALVRESNRQRLIAAYERYQRKEPGSLDLLLAEVRRFAERKIIQLERKAEGFAGVPTPDDFNDWAQEAVIGVWVGLDRAAFAGKSGSDFYAWVNKITFNKKTDFLKSLIKTKKHRVPLLVTIEDEDGKKEEVLNPEIYSRESEIHTSIPSYIQGDDRSILNLIVSGKDYIYISKVLNITVSAIKKRMERVRTNVAEHERKKQQNLKKRDDDYNTFRNKGKRA